MFLNSISKEKKAKRYKNKILKKVFFIISQINNFSIFNGLLKLFSNQFPFFYFIIISNTFVLLYLVVLLYGCSIFLFLVFFLKFNSNRFIRIRLFVKLFRWRIFLFCFFYEIEKTFREVKINEIAVD